MVYGRQHDRELQERGGPQSLPPPSSSPPSLVPNPQSEPPTPLTPPPPPPQTKMFPMGPVKTNTSRFPLNQIKERCGAASGDWVTCFCFYSIYLFGCVPSSFYLSLGKGGRCMGHPTGLLAALCRPHTARTASLARVSRLALSVALLGRVERYPRKHSNGSPRIGYRWVPRPRSGQSALRKCDQHSHKGRKSSQWAARTIRTFPCILCVDGYALGS